MGFQKYTNAEEHQVLSPEENSKVNDKLTKNASRSYADLPDEEKTDLSFGVDPDGPLN